MEESHLSDARLKGELTRTTFQLRLFGEVLQDGPCLEAIVDHTDPDWEAWAPRPDLRRMLLPLGPVAVYAASNFPFAFSVAGGDTASACAAGNPIIVKAHSGHPRLSAADAGAIVSRGTGRGRCSCRYVRADVQLRDRCRGADRAPTASRPASFTGSIPGGRALFDIASQRPDPIPFYGELGSLNPVFVTPGAR